METELTKQKAIKEAKQEIGQLAKECRQVGMSRAEILAIITEAVNDADNEASNAADAHKYRLHQAEELIKEAGLKSEK